MIELTQDDDPDVQRAIRILWFCAIAMFSLNFFIQFELYKISIAITLGVMGLIWYAGKLLTF